MRVNVYAEEMTDRIEIISKEIDGHRFTGLRFYLHLPVTVPAGDMRSGQVAEQVRGPFIHRPGDDDSAAVTFWGKRDLREVLCKALRALDTHYEMKQSSLRMTTMSEREQKLEAAWHKALNAWMDCSRDSTIHEANKAAVSMLAEALATPPTSEWNEAITEVIALVASGKGDDQALLRQRIRALKRKERT